MNELQKRLKDMVSMFISSEKVLTEGKIDSAVDEVRTIPLFASLDDSDVEEVRSDLKAAYSIKLDLGTLIEEKGHERWFLAKKASLDLKYWDRYKKYLLSDKGFSSSVVNTMDDMLDTLTDLLGDPSRDISYNRRGLIIGDIQSGKTANYTGLICKAVDSGYKVIVLLTGTIEKLRQQTQQRIDEGFVGSSSDAMMRQQEDNIIIGVGKYDSSIRPMVLTSVADDFKQKNANNLNFDLRNINGPVIFVIKKNSAVLKRLNKWLKTFNQNGTQSINHSLLVIDDESDNASINTKADPEETPTAINGQIRELLKMFSKSSYVGFTATPFANIFIDPDNYNDMVAEDLFPKDYIYNLNSPSNYIGARDIFGLTGTKKYMLERIVDDENDPESISAILPLRHKSTTIVTRLPADLKTAIEAFLLANTIEDLKGLNNNHRSMLVNVSRFTVVQDQIAVLCNNYLKDLQAACKNYCRLPVQVALKSDLIASLKNTYELVYPDIDYEWEEVQANLHKSCAGIVIQVFNQRAGQQFSYDEYKEGLRVIAVGGMSLSRGLTLEGLVVSYFYRNSKMYDTLMQMGRWFGYRGGYEDLCRIWMTNDSIEWYTHISQSTDELREEVGRYEDTGLTPMDFGLRVRSDLTSLLITARNKMRSTESRECVISMSGECIETPEIYSSEEKNNANKKRVIELVDKLYDEGKKKVSFGSLKNQRWGFKDVPSETVMDFIEQLEISPKNAHFNPETIAKFVKDYRGNELENWDIVFAGGSSTNKVDLGHGLVYHGPTRSYSVTNEGKIIKMSGSKRRLGNSADGTYGLDDSQIDDVKRMSGASSPSQRAYFTNIKRKPLLTIYIVELAKDKDNETREKNGNAFTGKEFVGFGVGIPTLSNQETKFARYVLNKVAIQQMFEGDIDEWEDGDD